MAVCSYVIYPEPGKTDGLVGRLNSIKGCKAIPSDQSELIILVTESDSDADEAVIQQSLKEEQEIQSLALIFGEVGAPLVQE